MTCLDLSFNDDMHDASTAALAALLATNPNVRKASIRITGITAGGALRLLACMSDSDPWRCMDMASHCHTIAHLQENADMAPADADMADAGDADVEAVGDA